MAIRARRTLDDNRATVVALLRHPVRGSVPAWLAGEDDFVGGFLLAAEPVLLGVLGVDRWIGAPVGERAGVDMLVVFGRVGADCLVGGIEGEMPGMGTGGGERGEWSRCSECSC